MPEAGGQVTPRPRRWSRDEVWIAAGITVAAVTLVLLADGARKPEPDGLAPLGVLQPFPRTK